ncbi:DUSP19 [Symbiodinium sp. CCMP2592]|nr:DUSP19 [Symbiodinium sp. CCMP2592]
MASYPGEEEAVVEVNLEWQETAGSQSCQLCVASTTTLAEFKAQCARVLQVELVHCPDFNDDMDHQQLCELGIGLSEVPVLLDLGPPLLEAKSEPSEPPSATAVASRIFVYGLISEGRAVTSGASFTPIFESSSGGKNFASVNAGNPKKLKVGGGTINGQFAQELRRVAGHDPDSYSPAHEALLRVAAQAGTARHGLVQAPASLRLPPCLEAAFIYLGRTPPEAEQVAGDSGRGGLVILDIFETKSRPYHDQNVAMVYTVGPQRGFEPDDATFLSKVRLVGRNVAAACHDYNMQRSRCSQLYEEFEQTMLRSRVKRCV